MAGRQESGVDWQERNKHTIGGLKGFLRDYKRGEESYEWKDVLNVLGPNELQFLLEQVDKAIERPDRNPIDAVAQVLRDSIRIAREFGLEDPRTVRINPKVLREISLIPHWFQHDLFKVQDVGAPRALSGHFGRATEYSPVVSKVHIDGLYLPIQEDPQAYFVTLDYGITW